MKSCDEFKGEYGKYLCDENKHCVFEGTDEWPDSKVVVLEIASDSMGIIS